MERCTTCGSRSGVRHGWCPRCRARDAAADAAFGDGLGGTAGRSSDIIADTLSLPGHDAGRTTARLRR